jgi:hypothetical protein
MKPPPRSKLSVGLLFLTMSISSAARGQETPAPDAPPTPAPPPAEALASFPHLVKIDAQDVLGAPFHWTGRQWEHFSIAVAGIGVAALLDGTARNHERNDHNRVTDQVAKDFEQFGQTGAFGVMGAFYVAGLASDNARARSVGEDGLIASLLSGGIITPVLKFAAGRARPRDTDKTFDLKPFSGNSSFPSGHSTEAFAVASVISAHYDARWVQVTSYGAATLVGFARIHHQAHFLSDVTAGAIIGTVTGRTVVHRNEKERRRYALMPVAGPHGEPGVGLALSF